MQFPAGNRKRDPGGDQVDAVCLDGHAFSSLRDGHGRMARQKPGHQADVDGIKMLNKDEGHACVGWHCCQERLEGVKAPGGCADAHNWKTAYDMLPCESEQIGAGKRCPFFSDAAVLLRWHADSLRSRLSGPATRATHIIARQNSCADFNLQMRGPGPGGTIPTSHAIKIGSEST